MEVGVRLIGIILRILNFLMLPISWYRARECRTVPPPTNPLLMNSAKELAEGIRNGQYTSEEIVMMYIDRVKEVNPYINAVVEDRYNAALDEAKAVDTKIAEARSSGVIEELVRGKPLLGVPFTVKESCSLGGLSNSVGCLEHSGRRAARDGEAVRRARGAGAIPLLVSNTPELCLGWETNNLLRGATNNPYCLNRTSGGSSGGEAALLGCGASAFSVSSDIAGSIRLPAAFCGVFGHKPTPGIIPIDGHIPTLSDPQFPKFLTTGPMARRAEDLPLLMSVLAGENRHMLNLDTPVNMKDMKVLYMTEAVLSPALIPVQKCIRDAIVDAAQYLQNQCGCTISDEKFKELEDSVEISVSVFFSMKDIPNMLADPADPKRSVSVVAELARRARGGASRSLQGLGFALLRRTRLFIPDARAPHYAAAAARLRDKMQSVLGDNGVFLYPVFNELAHHHNQVFLKASGVMYSMAFNILGMPACSVPLGLRGGLPLGIQVVAAPGQDRLCLAVAARLERGFGGWRAPPPAAATLLVTGPKMA